MFVKWECDCRGIILGNQCIRLLDCRDEVGEALTFEKEGRSLPKKEWVILNKEEEEDLIKEISSLIQDGYRARALIRLMRGFK